LVLERVFRVGGAAEAVVAIVAAGQGHLQRIEDRQVELDKGRLDVTADLRKVVLRVARRTEDPGVAKRGVLWTGELVFLAAHVHADGRLHFTAGQREPQPAGEARVEDRAGALAAIQLHAARRRCLQRGDGLRALLLPRQQERVEQAAAEDLLELRREV